MTTVTCDHCYLLDVQKVHQLLFNYDSRRKLAPVSIKRYLEH